MLDAVLALNETDTKVFDFASQAAPPADEPAGRITVPNAHLLFNGDFQRVGTSDLKIVGDDGASFFIRDYFAADKLSHLISPEGATLSASVVAALAGPLAPGQSAQAGAQQAGQPVIGRVDALSGSCTVVRNGVSVALNVGDTVRKGDVVQTAGGSAVAIVFADGSTFSLNANARMVLDEFVYNAGGTGNSALISLVQGTFSFVAGQVAKTGDMRVDTPVATMGIRGTAVLIEISANDGQTRFSVMVEPDGTTGSFTLYDKTSGSVIGTVNNSQIGWLVTPAGPLQVVAQQVQKTPAQLQQELGIVQQIFTIFNNNQQNPFVPDQQQDPNRRGDNPNDPNPQTAQGGGGGSGGLLAGGDPSEGATPGIVNPLPQPGTHVVKLPPLPGAPPPVIPGDNSGVVTVVVTPNAPPIAVNDPNGTPGGGNVITPNDGTPNDSDPEGSVIVVTTVRHITVVEGGQEVPGPAVTVSAQGATIEGTYGTLTIGPDGNYSFTPNAAFDSLPEGVTAADLFRYTISDPFGATATAVLAINLTGVNDAPVATNDTAQNGVEGVPAGSVLDNDIDPDTGDTISVVSAQHLNGEISGDPILVDSEGECGTAIEGTYGTLYLHADGTYTFTPNEAFADLGAGQTAVDQFEYTITDEHGETATAVLSINLTGANHAPQAGNVTLEANVLGNGGFEAAQDFEGWHVDTDTSLPYESYSEVSIDRSGSIFEGDSAVAVLRFSGQVENAGGTGDGPSITSDAFAGNAGDTIRFVYQLSAGTNSGSGDLGTVTGYIIDAETDEIIQQIYNSAPLGESTGMQTVNVELGYSGNFKIKFVVGSIDSTYGYVVGAQLDLGYAGIIRTGVSEDTPFTFSESAFLANTTDADGDLLSIDTVSSAHGAIVTVNEDGSVTYDARTSTAIQALGEGETLTDTITFTVRDEHGNLSNSATATVTVQGANDAPVISIANAVTEEDAEGGSTTLYGLSILDVDANQNELFDITVEAQEGTVALIGGQPAPTQSFSNVSLSTINQALLNGVVYTNPVEASPGLIDKVTLTVTDEHGGTDSMNFIFSVYGEIDTTLVGTAGKDMLFGTGHNDMFTGNGSADIFVFSHGNGHDTITDFNINEDRILIDRLPIASLQDLTISQGEGNSTIIDLGHSNGTITLNGVIPNQLSTANFIFHPENCNPYA